MASGIVTVPPVPVYFVIVAASPETVYSKSPCTLLSSITGSCSSCLSVSVCSAASFTKAFPVSIPAVPAAKTILESVNNNVIASKDAAILFFIDSLLHIRIYPLNE